MGAGIIGLAHAYLAAKQGKRVTVLERNRAANGAPVANFGMLWPIGQVDGHSLNLALESRKLWLELLQAARISHKNVGSLHVACREDEVAVGQEFAEIGPAKGYDVTWLNRDAVL